MKTSKVYHVVVEIIDTYGKLRIRLFFPSAALRQQFCATHRSICACIGRRPIAATHDDLVRTRMNLAFYTQLQDFVLIWDNQITK